MSKSDGSRYEAPRVVRLSDVTTGTTTCLDGPTGTEPFCTSGFEVQGQSSCQTGGTPGPHHCWPGAVDY